jgi:molybdate/tungstate transport system substrate-binding protein
MNSMRSRQPSRPGHTAQGPAMTHHRAVPMRWRAAITLSIVGVLAAACGSGSSVVTSTTAPAAAHGTAAVACAGSLLKLYEDTLGPAFKTATGDSFGGPPCAGSLALASEILANEINPGVFVAVGAHAIKELFPTNRAKFAMSVAADPLVIGYSSKSRYYTQLNEVRSGKMSLAYLWSLFATPGFKLGRTDPTQDPQGIFFILESMLAQKVLNLPAGEADQALGITPSSPFGNKSQMLDEDALPTDIATGIVDAGTEYLPEAKQYGLDYITLPDTLNFSSPAEVSLYSTVSLDVSGTVQQGEVIYLNVALVSPKKGTTFTAADETADQAFATFMVSSTGRSILANVGYRLVPPVLHLAPGVTAASAALPASTLELYNSLGGSISTS